MMTSVHYENSPMRYLWRGVMTRMYYEHNIMRK